MVFRLPSESAPGSPLAVELRHELGRVAVAAGGADGDGGVDQGAAGVEVGVDDAYALLVVDHYTRPEQARRPAPTEDWDRVSASHVMDLRATYARRAGDSDITSLVHDLLAASEEFRGLWERHQVGVRRADLKTFVHPEVGPVAVRCEVLLTEEADVKLLAYFPAEGTDAAEKLELLRVIGTQRLTSADSSPT